jgi:hypothetical protein
MGAVLSPLNYLNIRTLAIAWLLGCFFTTRGIGADKAISGKFWLSEHAVGENALDAVEFRPDGTCLVDDGERTGILGKYHADSDGGLRIEAEAGGRKAYSYKYQLLKYTLVLSNDDKESLYYVRLPQGPHPQFAEILGIFYVHTELGDCAGESTADHKFRDHLHEFVLEDHTYYDVSIDGTFSYGDGVLTYLPEHSNDPQPVKYSRDFIVNRDAKGLWQVDPFHDTIVCETPALNLDLPPPPVGYRKGGQP